MYTYRYIELYLKTEIKFSIPVTSNNLFDSAVLVLETFVLKTRYSFTSLSNTRDVDFKQSSRFAHVFTNAAKLYEPASIRLHECCQAV